MGRPPIGKAAMTSAERVRLYRLRHAAAKPVTKVTKPAEPDCRLTARIAELEAALRNEQQARLGQAQVDGIDVVRNAYIAALKALPPKERMREITAVPKAMGWSYGVKFEDTFGGSPKPRRKRR